MRSRRGVLRALAAAGALAVLAGCQTAAPRPAPTPGPWEAVEPPAAVEPAVGYAEARLATMSLREKITSLLMIHVPGTAAAPLRERLDRTGAGGLIIMGDNVGGSAADVARLVGQLSADPDLPVLTAIDQEGGYVRRLAGDDWPAGRQLRALPTGEARTAFASRAGLVASAGVAINFGIVADVTADPGSFIYSRVLGTRPGEAAARVAAAVEGESGRVLSTLKHFPGHGAVRGDSHTSIPRTDVSYDDWLSQDAPPFEAGIGAGAEVVMMGHLRYSAVDDRPATLSPEWHRILRDELGFDGIVVTDDMTMLEHSRESVYANPARNAVAAIAAGNTMLLYVGWVNTDAVVSSVEAAVDDGRISSAQLDDAALRLLTLRRELSGRTGPYVHCGEDCRRLVG